MVYLSDRTRSLAATGSDKADDLDEAVTKTTRT
jgi:hypothetical protein